jgi:hypothetical protein
MKDETFWNTQTKFIIITMKFIQEHMILISKCFLKIGTNNAVVISPTNETMMVLYPMSFYHWKEAEFSGLINNSNQIESHFKEIIRDMNGIPYRVLLRNEYPNVFLKSSMIHGVNWELMKTVAEHQNTMIINYYMYDHSSLQIWLDKLRTGHVDVALMTDPLFDTKMLLRFVNTFSTDGYCVMLPYPERKSFFAFLLKPYDAWTWMCITITLICLVVVWHFLNKHSTRNPNRAAYILFAFVAFFLGQGAEFREHRLIQKILIQLLILVTFVLSNAYQSVVISLMTESRYGEKIETIEGVFESEFKFKAPLTFMELLNQSSDSSKLRDKIIGILYSEDFVSLTGLSKNRTGIIAKCRIIDTLFKDTSGMFDADQRAIDHFYKVPEKFYTFFEHFSMSYGSPLTHTMRDYSLRIFESGVRQHWMAQLTKEDMTAVKERETVANEGFMLNLLDMSGAFYCLAIGCSLAFIVFLVELASTTECMKKCMRRCRNKNKVEPVVAPLFIRVCEAPKKADHDDSEIAVLEDDVEVYELV